MQNKLKFIGEIFMATQRMGTKEEVIKHLRTYKSDSMIMLFEAAYHPKVVWALPADPPPFRQDTSPYGNNPTNLIREAKVLYYFLHCKKMIANPQQRERVFIQKLEGLNKDEAIILVSIKDRKLDKVCKWLTYDLVSEAFPGVLPKKEKESPLAESAAGTKQPSPAPAKRGRGRPKGSKNGAKRSTNTQPKIEVKQKRKIATPLPSIDDLPFNQAIEEP